MLREISRVLKNRGVYICVSYGDPDIRNHYFEDKSEKYDWGKKHQWPYKIFKPTIEQAEKELVFNDKDKEKNKDYYHYVYVLGKVRLKIYRVRTIIWACWKVLSHQTR